MKKIFGIIQVTGVLSALMTAGCMEKGAIGTLQALLLLTLSCTAAALGSFFANEGGVEE
jgi:hypothetical protein